MTTFRYSSLLHFIEMNHCIVSYIRRQYMGLLSQLTEVEPISDDDFMQKVRAISKMGNIVICYVEDEIPIFVATGTVIFEPKLIRGGAPVAHIEDIVVHRDYRGRGISTTILGKLVELAHCKECYKVILDCREELETVYERAGFEKRGSQMALYF